MTKKMPIYLGLASAFLCMILLTACGENANSSSSSGSQAKVSPTIVAKKATPKSVGITISPKPTPTSKVLPTPTPTPAPPMMPTPTTPPMTVMNPGVSVAASAVLTLINQERASMNRPALTWDAGLQASAHQHNLSMAAVNTLSHQLSGEAAFGDRERAAGVNWTTSAAENIGVGSGDPTTAAVGLNTLMFNETPPDDGHRVNILATTNNVIGIDVITDSVHNKVWLTEDFAKI